MPNSKCKVLIVDDSEDDRFLLKRGLNKKFPACTVVGTAPDGETAIKYLEGTEPFSDRAVFPFPDVMLLDLKMPRKNGFDVLRWLNERDRSGLRVIVLSTSSLASDIEQATALGADAYLVKNWEGDASAQEILNVAERLCKL